MRRRRTFTPDEVTQFRNGAKFNSITLPVTCTHCRLMKVDRLEARCACSVCQREITTEVLRLSIPDWCPLRNGSLIRIPDENFPHSHKSMITNVERATFDKGA